MAPSRASQGANTQRFLTRYLADVVENTIKDRVSASELRLQGRFAPWRAGFQNLLEAVAAKLGRCERALRGEHRGCPVSSFEPKATEQEACQPVVVPLAMALRSKTPSHSQGKLLGRIEAGLPPSLCEHGRQGDAIRPWYPYNLTRDLACMLS